MKTLQFTDLNSVSTGVFFPLSIFLLFSGDLHVVLTSKAPGPGSAELGNSLVQLSASFPCCLMCAPTSASFVLNTRPLLFCHPSLSHSCVLWGLGVLRKVLGAHYPGGWGAMSQSPSEACWKRGEGPLGPRVLPVFPQGISCPLS